jgi:hypothetical protein
MTPIVPQFYLDVLNQLFELEKKLGDQLDNRALARPLNRMKQLFEESLPVLEGSGSLGLFVHNPYGEKYTETRTDCDASIAGEADGTLRIVEVIKPIVYLRGGGHNQIIQRGVVIAE